jgi:hypothetical protein
LLDLTEPVVLNGPLDALREVPKRGRMRNRAGRLEKVQVLAVAKRNA